MADTPATNDNAALSEDVGARQVAVVYAKGLLAATEKAKVTDEVVAEFDALMQEVLGKNPRFAKVLGSGLIKAEDKSAMIDRVFKGRASKTFTNFLKVLSNHNRLDILPELHKELHRQLDTLRGRVRVQIKTAAPLANGVAEGVLKSLRPLIQGDPQLEQAVDPRLIGGMILRVGDTLFDGSVARQLAQVREKMIARSVHEIQSRRDRFRHSGGN